MSEQPDVRLTSRGEACKYEFQPPGDEPAPPSSSQEENDINLECKKAFVFSKEVAEAGTQEEADDSAVEEYEEILRDFGFDVRRVKSHDIKDVKQTIAESRKGPTQIVVLLVLESDSDSDLDGIVEALKDCEETSQKLLVFCRIGRENNADTADCLKWCEQADVHRNLRNISIISLAVGTRKLAMEFIKKLTQKQSSSWSDKGIGYIMQYELSTEEFRPYNLKTRNGLEKEFTCPPSVSARMLKNDPHFKKIIGDGSQLHKLDKAVFESLCNEAKLNEDPLSDLMYRNCENRKALIINNAEFQYPSKGRPESQVDCANLRHLFGICLQYDVEFKQDLTAAEMHDAVKNFACGLGDVDSSILVVMSHGSLETILDGANKPLKESDLLDLMRTGQRVKGKPRLVIFQVCQARQGQEASDTTRVEQARLVGNRQYGDDPVTMVELPNDQCGIIIAHSTSPGDLSFRGSHGSRFITALCATFYEFAHKEDVGSMINRVNFIMTHGFKRPVYKGETMQIQLPCWSVLTDRKFFLANTGQLNDVDSRTSTSTSTTPISNRQPEL